MKSKITNWLGGLLIWKVKQWYWLTGRQRFIVVDLVLVGLALTFMTAWFWAGELFYLHTLLLLVAGGLIAFRWFVFLLMPNNVGPLPFLNLPELDRLLDDYCDELFKVKQDLTRLLPEFLSHPLWKATEYHNLRVPEVQQFRNLWWQIIVLLRDLQLIRRRFIRFYEVNKYDQVKATQAMTLMYWAQMLELQVSIRIINKVTRHPFIEHMLDDADVYHGVYPDNYQRLLHNAVHISELAQGWLFYCWLQKSIGQFDLSSLSVKWQSLLSPDSITDLVKEVMRYFDAGELVTAFVTAGRFIKRESYRLWFPVQKNAAEAFGKIRISLRQHYLVGPDHIAEMRKRLRPMDIVITRSARLLSNAWLPGFWTHSIIYLDEPNALADFFSQEESVIRYLEKEYGSRSILDVIKKRHPEVWQQWTREDQEYPATIIEAVADGVIVRSLNEAANSDFVSALRPNVDRLILCKILLKVFESYGKPYDFGFDYKIDGALSCSELIYKSYTAYTDFPAKPIKMNVLGERVTLPVHEFLRSFVRQEKQKGVHKFWDFVFFLDGDMARGTVTWKDKMAYLKTVNRTRWDYLL